MSLRERAQAVRLWCWLGSDGPRVDVLADCAVDDPLAFLWGTFSTVVRRCVVRPLLRVAP